MEAAMGVTAFLTPDEKNDQAIKEGRKENKFACPTLDAKSFAS